MPCQSYEDPRDSISEREVRNKLARIACRALQHIEEANDGGLEKLILQDPEIAEWWREHKEADRKAQEKRRIAAERGELRRQALAKLSTEERQVLGIKTR